MKTTMAGREIARLDQKRGLGYRKFILYEDRVAVETKTGGKFTKYEVKINRLGFDLYYQRENMLPRYITVGVIAFIPIATLIAFLCGVAGWEAVLFNSVIWWSIAALIYFSKHQDDVSIIGGEVALVLYRNVPDEKAVSGFTDKIISASKQYFKTQYTQYREYLPEEHYLAQLLWLKDRNIIGAAEVEHYIKEYKLKKLL
jgi:hypothetical protein